MKVDIITKVNLKSIYNDMLDAGAGDDILHRIFNIIIDCGLYAVFDIETGAIITLCDNKTDFMEKCNKYYEKATKRNTIEKMQEITEA